MINPDIPLPGHLNIFDHIDWTQALAPATPQLPQHTWATAPTSRSSAQPPLGRAIRDHHRSDPSPKAIATDGPGDGQRALPPPVLNIFVYQT